MEDGDIQLPGCLGPAGQRYLLRVLPAGLKPRVGAQGPGGVGYYPRRSKAVLISVRSQLRKQDGCSGSRNEPEPQTEAGKIRV